jgi:hypothetical protein
MKDMIALTREPVKIHIFGQAPASDKPQFFRYTYRDEQNVTGGQT